MIEWAVTSSVLILVVLVLRRCLKGRISLRLQYGLWALVLLRLLIPVNFGGTAVSVLNSVAGAREHFPDPVVVYLGDETAQAPAVEAAPTRPPEESGGQVVQNQPQDTTAQRNVPSERGTSFSVGALLGVIWAVGAGGLGLWLLGVNLRFARRLGRDRRPLAVEDYPLPVYVSGAVATPCLFGLVRPCVYVTEEAAAHETVLRHTLAHELTHCRHGDHLWAALRGLSLVLHWYNPLVWAAAVLSRRDGELCCDEATVRRLGEEERAAYGRTLLAVTCQGPGDPLLTATSMTGSGKGIKERILLLSKRPRTAVYTLVTVICIAAAAVGCTFTGAQRDAGEVPITLAEGLDAPAAVSDYAQEPVSSAMAYCREELDCEITGAEIVGLTQIDTGTAAENSGQSLYLLEYRLYPAHPDQVKLAQGMRMEAGAITEWSSAGQPYLLLHWEDFAEETRWQPVCVTDTNTITQVYGTAEMLENHGNAYTAAAMELYEQFVGNNSMDETFYQLLRVWYNERYAGQRWYFQTEQPEQPQEGDLRLGPVRYEGGSPLEEGRGEVYTVTVSRYENGQFQTLFPPSCTLVLRRDGWNGPLRQVIGAIEEDTSGMTVGAIVRQAAYGLMDAEVSLQRDGYVRPVGPGNWMDLFDGAAGEQPEIQIQEGYEPIYGQGDYWDQWRVEGFSALRYYSAAEDRWSANTIDVTRSDFYTPRGVRVGDSRAQVLAAYPEALTGDYWGRYPEEPDLLAYLAQNKHPVGEISDLSQLEFGQSLGPAILFFFEGDTLRQITLTNMFD